MLGVEAEGLNLCGGALGGKLKEGRDTVEFNKHIVNGSKEMKDKREQGPTAEGAPKCPKEQKDFVLAIRARTASYRNEAEPGLPPRPSRRDVVRN